MIDFSLALDAEPAHKSARKYRAACYLEQDLYDKALTDYQVL